MKSSHKFAGVALTAGAVLLLTWNLVPLHSMPAKPAKDKSPPLVSVVQATSATLPIKLQAEGHLLAVSQVDVRPQSNGIVQKVLFREGNDVKRGQPLFDLDTSDAQAQWAKASAVVAQYQAQVEDAQREVARSQRLAGSRFIAASAVDTAQGKLDATRAQLQAAQADVQNARTLLERTRIFAPMAGVAGVISVHPGSLAQTGATNTPLVSLVQLDPIAAEFALPEQYLPNILAARSQRNIQVRLLTGNGTPVQGRLVFVNNTVDTATGSITVKAEFPNPTRSLWPGSFVRLEVDAGNSDSAIVLPPQAVLEGPSGRFVYLVDANNTLSAHPVTLLRIQDQKAVVQGLNGGETLVAEGGKNLKAGVVVKIAGATP